MLFALFEYRFLQYAVISCLLASIVCGLIGVIIVEKKLVMMSGGIAHTAYGGVGLGYLMGFEPIGGAFLFAILAAIGIGTIKRGRDTQSDVIIGLFWSLGMALGIVFIACMPGYPPDITSYLFGNILSVTRQDLTLMVALTFLVAFLVISLYNVWKAYLFDEEFVKVIGIRIYFLDYLLLIMVAMTVVVLIRVAGIVLVLALLTAPSAMAALFSDRLKNRMILAIVFGACYCLIGLWISYTLDISSGASIVILSVVSYFTAFSIRSVVLRRRKRRAYYTDKKGEMGIGTINRV